MNFKVGDRVVFTGESGNGITNGKTYQVCYNDDGLFAVYGDDGDEHFMCAFEFKPIDDD